MSTKTRQAQQVISDNGDMDIRVYGPAGSDGKQAVSSTINVKHEDLDALPTNMKLIMLAKGYGAFLAGRYADGSDVTESHTQLWKDLQSGSFSPSRAGTGQPSAFHEAVHQVLVALGKRPADSKVSDTVEQLKSLSKAQVMALSKNPKVQHAQAQIEKARADEKLRNSRGKAKDASEDVFSLLDIAAE